MSEIEKLGNVFYRVDDMDDAVSFYQEKLGLPLKFRDGNRWVAFDVGGTTLALAPRQNERTTGAVVSIKVTDVDAWAREAAERGVAVGEPTTGPHERTVEVQDPDGNSLVIYSALSR